MTVRTVIVTADTIGDTDPLHPVVGIQRVGGDLYRLNRYDGQPEAEMPLTAEHLAYMREVGLREVAELDEMERKLNAGETLMVPRRYKTFEEAQAAAEAFARSVDKDPAHFQGKVAFDAAIAAATAEADQARAEAQELRAALAEARRAAAQAEADAQAKASLIETHETTIGQQKEELAALRTDTATEG